MKLVLVNSSYLLMLPSPKIVSFHMYFKAGFEDDFFCNQYDCVL